MSRPILALPPSGFETDCINSLPTSRLEMVCIHVSIRKHVVMFHVSIRKHVVMVVHFPDAKHTI
jgi:hypothetical protein